MPLHMNPPELLTYTRCRGLAEARIDDPIPPEPCAQATGGRGSAAMRVRACVRGTPPRCGLAPPPLSSGGGGEERSLQVRSAACDVPPSPLGPAPLSPAIAAERAWV